MDLHTHSIYSDGLHRPEALVRKAKAAGLNVFAITDHNCFAGVRAGMEEAKRLLMTFLPAIELHSFFTSGDHIARAHILGYGFNIDAAQANIELCQYLKHINSVASERISALCALSAAHPFSFTGARGESCSVSVSFPETLPFRSGFTTSYAFSWPLFFKLKQHFNDFLLGDAVNGFVLQKQNRLEDIMRRNRGTKISPNPAFTEGRKMIVPDPNKHYTATADAVRMLGNIGAVPVLAHPGEGGIRPWLSNEDFEGIIALGIRGLEVFTPKHTPEMVNHFLETAKRHDLVVTGGTDFHAKEDDPEKVLGMFDATSPIESDPVEVIMGRAG